MLPVRKNYFILEKRKPFKNLHVCYNCALGNKVQPILHPIDVSHEVINQTIWKDL